MKSSNPAHSRTSSVASILMRTQGFIGTQYWVWPLLAALLLMGLGAWVRQKMEGVAKQQVAAMLQLVLNANIEALRSWSVTMKDEAANVADDDRGPRTRLRADPTRPDQRRGEDGFAGRPGAGGIARPAQAKAGARRV